MLKTIQNKSKEHIKELGDIFKSYDHTAEELDVNVDVDIIKGLNVLDFVIRKKTHNGTTAPIPLSHLGGAKRKKLQLALLEWQRKVLEGQKQTAPLILLYDEPDVHFDYDAQRRLLDVLKRIAKQPNLQVIVVTHSLVLIDRVDLKQILHLEHITEKVAVPQTRVQKLNEWPDMLEIAKSLGLRNHLVLNACLLITEGESEEKLIPALFYRYKGFSLEAAGIELLKDKDKGKGAAWKFGSYSLRQGRKAFIVVDNDARLSIDNQKRTITELAITELNEDAGKTVISEKKNFVFLGTKELEDVFCDTLLVQGLQHLYRNYIEDVPELFTESLTDAVVRARTHKKGLFEGLKPHFRKIRTLPRDEQKIPSLLTKPALANSLLEAMTEELFPEELKITFDLLESYVEG